MKDKTFTLVPIGGLGNRLNAIASAIVYCKKTNRKLQIIWFKDSGLNCPYHRLFSIQDRYPWVNIRNATFMDFLLRDNPRKKNFWLPILFQYFIFDKCIYESNVYEVVSAKIKPDFGDIDIYANIFMVSYWRFWTSPDMWHFFNLTPDLLHRVEVETSAFTPNTIGLHIRRTDNMYSINQSPTELFEDKINEEIAKNSQVNFYLASDSLEEKKRLIQKFGNRIITSIEKTERNTEKGIVDAFVEMHILSKTKIIYATAKSSFSELASFLNDKPFIELKNE